MSPLMVSVRPPSCNATPSLFTSMVPAEASVLNVILYAATPPLSNVTASAEPGAKPLLQLLPVDHALLVLVALSQLPPPPPYAYVCKPIVTSAAVRAAFCRCMIVRQAQN